MLRKQLLLLWRFLDKSVTCVAGIRVHVNPVMNFGEAYYGS